MSMMKAHTHTHKETASHIPLYKTVVAALRYDGLVGFFFPNRGMVVGVMPTSEEPVKGNKYVIMAGNRN